MTRTSKTWRSLVAVMGSVVIGASAFVGTAGTANATTSGSPYSPSSSDFYVTWGAVPVNVTPGQTVTYTATVHNITDREYLDEDAASKSIYYRVRFYSYQEAPHNGVGAGDTGSGPSNPATDGWLSEPGSSGSSQTTGMVQRLNADTVRVSFSVNVPGAGMTRIHLNGSEYAFGHQVNGELQGTNGHGFSSSSFQRIPVEQFYNDPTRAHETGAPTKSPQGFHEEDMGVPAPANLAWWKDVFVPGSPTPRPSVTDLPAGHDPNDPYTFINLNWYTWEPITVDGIQSEQCMVHGWGYLKTASGEDDDISSFSLHCGRPHRVQARCPDTACEYPKGLIQLAPPVASIAQVPTGEFPATGKTLGENKYWLSPDPNANIRQTNVRYAVIPYKPGMTRKELFMAWANNPCVATKDDGCMPNGVQYTVRNDVLMVVPTNWKETCTVSLVDPVNNVNWGDHFCTRDPKNYIWLNGLDPANPQFPGLDVPVTNLNELVPGPAATSSFTTSHTVANQMLNIDVNPQGGDASNPGHQFTIQAEFVKRVGKYLSYRKTSVQTQGADKIASIPLQAGETNASYQVIADNTYSSSQPQRVMLGNTGVPLPQATGTKLTLKREGAFVKGTIRHDSATTASRSWLLLAKKKKNDWRTIRKGTGTVSNTPLALQWKLRKGSYRLVVKKKASANLFGASRYLRESGTTTSNLRVSKGRVVVTNKKAKGKLRYQVQTKQGSRVTTKNCSVPRGNSARFSGPATKSYRVVILPFDGSKKKQSTSWNLKPRAAKSVGCR